MLTVDQVLHTEVPHMVPTVLDVYKNSEILVIYKGGSITMVHNESHHRTSRNYNGKQEFLDHTGLGQKEFDLMYRNSPKLETLLQNSHPYENIKSVMVADL